MTYFVIYIYVCVYIYFPFGAILCHSNCNKMHAQVMQNENYSNVIYFLTNKVFIHLLKTFCSANKSREFALPPTPPCRRLPPGGCQHQANKRVLALRLEKYKCVRKNVSTIGLLHPHPPPM